MKHAVIALLLLLAFSTAFAGEKKYCDLSFTVTKEPNRKPVKYASVVLHGVDSRGKQLHEGMQLKTDGEGHAQAPGVPYGKIRVQVIATGLQTFGDDYELNEPAKEISITLKPPQGQYSIYDERKPDQKPPDQKPPDAKPPQTKP